MSFEKAFECSGTVLENFFVACPAIFYTAFHNYENKWPAEIVTNNLDSKYTNNSALSVKSLFKKICSKVQDLYNIKEKIIIVQKDIEVIKEKTCLLNSHDFEKSYIEYSQQIRNNLNLKIDQKIHQLKLANLQVKNERLRNEDLSYRYSELKVIDELGNSCADQSLFLHDWYSQKLGVFTRSQENTHAILRMSPCLNSVDFELPNQAPLIRGSVDFGIFGHVMLNKLRVLGCNADMTDIARVMSAAYAPGALTACVQLLYRIDQAILEDLTRLGSFYSLDWDKSTRILHVLFGKSQLITATIHISYFGTIKLMNLKKSIASTKSGVDTNNVIEIDSNSFITPLSSSLDDWLMEINDYCHTIT